MYDMRKDINAFAEGVNFEREHTRLIKERSRQQCKAYERKIIEDRITLDFISVVMTLAMNYILLSFGNKELWNISFVIMIWEVFKFLLNIIKMLWKK